MSEQSLSRLAIFSGFSNDQNKLVNSYSIRCRYPKNDVIFEQGEPAESLYILIKGEVGVEFKPYDGPKIIVSYIRPGGVFGWSSALGRSNYTSSAIALKACETICISHHNLLKIFEKDPHTGGILIIRLSGLMPGTLDPGRPALKPD
jgi:CRP-like cAMP-binding protein